MLVVLALSGCTRGTPPAEVIYRDAQTNTQELPKSIEVKEVETPSQPNAPLPTAQVIIGLIAPLTGPQAEIGAQLRDAALMGLYDAILDAPRLGATATPRLLIKDSAGNAETSVAAANELIEAGAQVIIGPLVSSNVEAVGRVARTFNVPVVAFSNNKRIARPGVYVFGFVPSQQVDRIADYAANQKIEHFSAIAAQDDYGRMVVKDFSKNLANRGLSVQPVEFFKAGALPPSPVLTRIASNAVEIGRQRKGVFLPVTGQALSAISLRFMQDIKANNGFLKLLGTGLWDHPQTLNDPGMRGAWFATTSPKLSYEYNTRFFEQYGYGASRIASLAYDAVHMFADAGGKLGADALTNEAITRKEGYEHVANGKVLFTKMGTVKRALAIVEVADQGFRVLEDPAFSK